MESIAIRVSGLKKSFPKGKEQLQVLKGIDMEIKTGEIIGYLGSNGAGKSTTVKIMCGLIPDFEGEVNILGHNLRKECEEIKRHIGYIPESAVMYEHLTPMEYLEFIGSLYGLQEDILHEKITRLLGLFEMQGNVNERMVTFSKGMKQKVHILSGLLHNPDILFMDEPLNGLDANSVMMIKEMISQLMHDGKTIFYCSHLMDVVEKVATRIILINDGIIIADGSAEVLKNEADTSSLEALFAKLTGKGNQSEKAGQMVNIFEESNK